MQQDINFAEVWHAICFSAGTLSCYHTPTHNQRHRQHIQICINIACYVLTAAICITLNELLADRYQRITFHNVFAFRKLLIVEVMYLLIRFIKTKLFP